MSRPIDSGSTFVTGGDVSRFQRRSMPATRTEAMRAAAPAIAAYSGPAAGGSTVVFNPGPTVRISRGKIIEVVPVGGK